MYCINLESNDPFFNLAVEEFLLKNSNEEYLILGINNPSLIIGKHQSAHREVNTKFITENDIPVIRRISGGGTVFHDKGNINFTFIRESETGKQVDFQKYTKPVLDFLLLIGVDARLVGKSDLKVEGLKISGNAEHVYHKRVLHHGTLLFNTSLDMLRNSIRTDKSCYSTRGVESNPSSVTNISTIIISYQDIEEFRSLMMNFFLDRMTGMKPYQLSQYEKEQADLLSSSKYKTWDWNWAYGPEYSFFNQFVTGGVRIALKLFVKDGIIMDCFIEGSSELTILNKKLKGCRHMVDDLSEVLKKERISIPDIDIYKFF